MDDLIKTFISGYSSEVKPQSIDKVKGDFQLTQMKVLLNDIIRTNNIGSIIDIGCGNGTLLYVLDSINVFHDFPDVKYYGFDFNNQIIDAINIAMNQGLFNNANFRTLQDNWSTYLHKSKPNIVVMRNVFHELTIEQLVEYFYEFSVVLSNKDFIIFQDTTTLLEAEKGRAGWKGAGIERILKECGYKTILTPDLSKKDISVFTIKAYEKRPLRITIETLKNYFIEERQKQLEELLTVFDSITQYENKNNIATARISHDILSIKKQLGHKMDDKAYESIYLLLYYALMLVNNEDGFFEGVKKDYKYFEVNAFQNRGTPLKSIYSFLSNKSKKILEINGSKLIGKKSLIYHALKRFKHNRIPVFIECNNHYTITNLFEKIIETLNIVKFFDVELISEFGQLTLKQFIKQNTYIGEFEKIIPEVIIVLCNVEAILSPDNHIENEDVLDFIQWWIHVDNAKLFIESDRAISWDIEQDLRDNIALSFFPFSSNVNDTSYGKYRFVIQYFQETIPAGYLGLDPVKPDFCEQLFECINNHPYLAYLASKIIIQQKDEACLVNEDMLKEIIEMISTDFVSKFNIENDEKGIIYVLSLCDGIIDQEIIDKMLEYKNIINQLIEKGILYNSGQEFYKLLPFFAKTVLDIDEATKLHFINYMKPIYSDLYNLTNKPKYYRLLYLHNILGKEDVKQKLFYLLPELSKGAEEFYKEKAYTLSVSLYRTIQKVQVLSSQQELRFANALVRSFGVAEGLSVFKKIFDAHPSWDYAKVMCAESLLFVEEKLDYGLQLLNNVSEPHRNTYYYRLLGDIYKIKQKPEKVYENYDKALQQITGYGEGVKVLIKAISYAKELGDETKQKEYFDFYHNMSTYSEAIDVEYGSYLERKNQLSDSKAILEKIYSRNPSNVYAVLAYVKTLCSLSQYDIAKRIIDIADKSKEVTPENLRLIDTAKIHYLICNNEFEEAVDILQAKINKEKKNIHLYGQWADLYYKYYIYKQDKTLIDLGLKYYSKIIKTTNVPAMISCKMLANIADDSEKVAELENRISQLTNYKES